ncbi:hypothetical protein [Amycolatopsis sp. NPDC051061]|uniref:hypothetical protein n=1 Tax=Amycolatopsis sp. NPDC051061 TaxID=3155042 RepID=UPI003427A8EA
MATDETRLKTRATTASRPARSRSCGVRRRAVGPRRALPGTGADAAHAPAADRHVLLVGDAGAGKTTLHKGEEPGASLLGPPGNRGGLPGVLEA